MFFNPTLEGWALSLLLSPGFRPPREALLLSPGFRPPREAVLCSSDRTLGGWAVSLSLNVFVFILLCCPQDFAPQGKLGWPMLPRSPAGCSLGFRPPREAGAAWMLPRSPAGEGILFVPRGFVPQGNLFVIPQGFVPQGKLGWRRCRARQRVSDGGSETLGHTSSCRQQCSTTNEGGRCCARPLHSSPGTEEESGR